VGHAWTATGPLTEEALTSAGFVFECFSGRLGELPGLGWPVEVTADWQNGYVCEERR
jgi:hypothetical protein